MKLSSVFMVVSALLILDATIASGQQQQQGENSPFVFEQRHYTTTFQEKHGRVRVLPRFSQRSELLRGVDNCRLSILEAEPNSFLVPNHEDAEVLVYVRQGNGIIGLLFEDRSESFEIRRGDIFRIPPGIGHYLVNKDNSQRLVLVKLFQPISNPGQYEPFFGARFERAFSNEVLEAALNAKESEISRIFGPKRRGIFMGASEEQIRSLDQQSGHGQSRRTFNILDKRPTQANQFGQVKEANIDDYPPLQELNVAVAFTNITRGGMSGPWYNSKAWRLAVILSEEDGYFEEVQRSQRGQGEPSYTRVSGPLRQETVVIVPPGNPAVFVASNNGNLEIISFEINAISNQKIPLAGRGNVYNQLPRAAKVLSFGAPAREVEELFSRNKLQFFSGGPQQQPRRQGGGGGEGELKMVV